MTCDRVTGVAGLTFIELLVSLLLASLIMLGLTQLVMAQLKSDLSIRDVVNAQQVGRFSLYALTRDIQLAGYVSRLGEHLSPINWALTQEGGVGELKKDNDRISIQRIAFNDDYNCLGYPVAAGHLVQSNYYVKDSKLYCKTTYYKSAGSSGTEKKSDTQALVENVESLQFLFGVRPLIESAAYVATFVSADEFQPLAHEVLSIRVGLMIKGEHALTKGSYARDPLGHMRILDRIYLLPSDGFSRYLHEQRVSLKNARRSVI